MTSSKANPNAHLTSERQPARNTNRNLAGNTARKHSVFVWPAYALFFLILYLPVTHDVLKGVMVAGVTAIIFVRYLINHKGLRLHSTIRKWALFYSVAGVFYILLGLIEAAPGALFSSFVYVIFPLLYVIFIAAATDARIWLELLKILPIAAIAIGLGTLEYLLWTVGIFPNSLYVAPDLVHNIVFYNGYVQMSHYSLSTLVFLVPYLVGALVVYTKERASFISRKILWIAFLSGTGVALLSGRRALLIVIVLAPLLTWFFRAKLPISIRLASRRQVLTTLLTGVFLVLSIGLYLGRTVNLDWRGLQDLVVGGFDSDFSQGAATRSEQFHALLSGWEEQPVLGHGLGSYTPELVRSDRPWEYELQYNLLLFQTGLIGVALYGSGVLWLYWKGIKMIRTGSLIGIHMVPVLVGTTCFLVANAVDPYLQTFGQLWTLFLPIGLINWQMVSVKATAVKSATA
ncbi:MAG: O-antigen ligase family protein [Candidatus Acidiferrales bacterium]